MDHQVRSQMTPADPNALGQALLDLAEQIDLGEADPVQLAAVLRHVGENLKTFEARQESKLTALLSRIEKLESATKTFHKKRY